MAVRKKKQPVRRKRLTGYDAAPMDSFESFKSYVRTDIDPKLVVETLKEFVKDRCPKEHKLLNAAPEWCFKTKYFIAATVEWEKRNHTLPANWFIERKIVEFIEELRKQSKIKREEKPKLVKPPHEILKEKASDFISEVENVIDDFINGVYLDVENYSPFLELKKIGASKVIATKAIEYYKPLKEELELLLTKKDKDLVEGYQHLTQTQKKKYLKLISHIISDLEKYAEIKKAVRKTRAPKPKSVEQQIKNLKYLNESTEYKIASIQPEKILKSKTLFVFNVKTRILTEYVSKDGNPLGVKGTTIQNFDEENSRCVKLRKPEEFLQIVLTSTPKQISLEWSRLTTKTTQPNGRINADTILLKVK